jgi:hypothetical protein
MSMTGGAMTNILSVLAINIPVYLVWIIAFIIAIVNIKNYPKVSLLTITSVIILFIVNVLSSIFTCLMPLIYKDYGWSTATVGLIMGTINITRSFVTALAWALIIGAIFGWRNRPDYLMAEDRQKK